MLDVAEDHGAPSVMLSEMTYGALPMVKTVLRGSRRGFYQASELSSVACPRWRSHSPASARRWSWAYSLFAPDELDWADEVRPGD